jgi:hypothetical protein
MGLVRRSQKNLKCIGKLVYIVFCVRSVAATFLSLIAYELITVFFVRGEYGFGYFHFGAASPDMIIEKYLPFLLVSAAALLGAVYVNSRFRRYN